MKKFVDKYYDDIVRINKLIEQEKHNRDTFNVINIIGWLISYIGSVALLSMNIAMMNTGIWICIISTIIFLVNIIIAEARRSRGEDLLKLLKQIRDGLTRINLKSLPKEYKIKISSLIKEIDDVVMNIGNGFDPEPRHDVHFVWALNSGSEYDNDSDVYTEGFNRDVSKIYRQSFNIANSKIKEAKKFMKTGEYIEAEISIREARKEVSKAQKEINDMASNTNLPDNILSSLYGGLISFTNALIFAIPTFGVSFGVAAIKNHYTKLNLYYTKIKDKKDIDSTVFNTYLNYVNHVFNEVLRTLQKLEAEIANKENGSNNDNKSDKKKLKNKDKTMNESVSVKNLLASDLLADMDDLF